MKTTITRKSRNIGYGYSTNVQQGVNPNGSTYLYVTSPNAPDYTGTVNSICNKLQQDRLLQSLRSGGTSYAEAWFVKVDGRWHRITNHTELDDLYVRYDEGGYLADSVEVEYK